MLSFNIHPLANIITKFGGKVEDEFVVKPAITILAETKLVENFSRLGIEKFSNEEDYLALAEMNSRITYLNFKENSNKKDRDNYVNKVLNEFGHKSINSSYFVTFLIAGCSVEASMELIAHKEANVSRLTTSKTSAMSFPIYFVGDNEELKQAIKEVNTAKNYQLNIEDRNRMNPGQKATALTFTMNLKDYHKLFIGRISMNGVEKEVMDICSKMCNILHDKYPLAIEKPEEYLSKNNSEKYFGG